MTDETAQCRIINAAGPIFAERGFNGATVREICDAAGVNLAAINYYFGDKQRLYIETVFAARAARVQRYPFPDWEHETTAEQKFFDFILMFLNRLVALQNEPWQVRLLMREILQPTEACRKLVEDYFRPVFNQLLEIIDELAERSLSEQERNKFGFSVIGQCLYYRYASEVTQMFVGQLENEPAFSRQQLADHIFEFSLAGIRSTTLSATFHRRSADSLPLPDVKPRTN